MRTIAILFLFACAASAQDSLVERLETEMRTLVGRVDTAAEGAFVTIPSNLFHATGMEPVISASASGILVGTPPVVVAPYSCTGTAERVRVRLADGRDVVANRWGGDADLGVSVFRLPEDVAKGLKGVDVEGEWSRLGAGSLAVVPEGGGHGGPTLGFVAAAEPRLGTIDVPGEGPAVFGSRGALIGLRGGADVSTCAACHGGPQVASLGDVVDSRLRLAALNLLNPRPSSPWDKLTGTGFVAQNPHSAVRVTGQLVAGPVIRRVLDDLERHEAIRHSYLGVVVGDEAGPAARITAVVPDSPAAAAGLVAGAKIVSIDDLSCPSAALFSRVLVLHRPGEEVTVKVQLREGDAVPSLFKVRLGERAAARSSFATAASIGLTCVELGSELRRFLGFPNDLRGVVVQDVVPGSPAEKAGIKRGDVITTGDGGPTPNLEELNAAIAGARSTIELSGVRSDGGSRRSATSWEAKVSIPDR